MGYTTYFDGAFTLNRPLTPEHRAYLLKFADTRRMQRVAKLTAVLADPVREAVGLPVGDEGGFYVGPDGGEVGQNRTGDIADYNKPPAGQPGLWCQWVPNELGTVIEHDGGEKFYYYVEWLEYLVEHFLKPWGYSISGEVTWSGEESTDHGKIVAKRNKITTKVGRVVYE